MLRAPISRAVQFLFLCLASACAPRPVALPPSGPARLLVIGDAVLPRASNDDERRADVGGISGAFYDARGRVLVAVSDDRDRPRLLLFNLQVAPSVQMTPAAVVEMQPPHLGRRSFDLEGVAPGPRDHLFVSSEGDPRDPEEPAPGIYEYRRDGRFVRSLPLPRAYLGSDSESGMRANGALEGLSLSPGGRRLFAATESSLRQDGPEANFDHGATTRLLVYELGGAIGIPREYAYRTEPLQRPADYVAPTGDTGVSEILALSDTELLFLERGFVRESATTSAARTANTIRIYRATLDPAAEVTGRESLAADPPAAVLTKELMLDAANIAPELSQPLRGLDNFEAMTFGPRLPDGRSTLVLISDDNFHANQVTAVVVLAWGPASAGPRAGTMVTRR